MNQPLAFIAPSMIILGFISSVVFASKKQCPRELFAFFALFAWVGWGLFQFVDIDLGREFDRGYRRALSIEEWTLTLFLLALPTFGSLWWMIHIHNNWPTDIISEKDYWRRASQKKDSIFVSAWNQFCTFLSLKWSMPLHKKPRTTNPQPIIPLVHPQEIPWRKNALEILHLLNPQYKVNSQEDWYPEHNCYTVIYGKENKGALIHCCQKEPSLIKIHNLIEFINEQETSFDNILILIEQGHQPPRTTRMGSITIKYHYKEDMLSNLINFRPYFQQLVRQFKQERIHVGSPHTLADVYTPLSAYNQNNLSYDNVEQYILNWATKEQQLKHLTVLGDYGQGKSVLSLKVSLELSKRHLARVPILIELKSKSPRTMSIKDLLHIWAQKYSASTEALLKLHEEGKLLLIFEGFDEMDLTGDRDTRLDHFRHIWKLAQYPKARILFTGRPNFFMDEEEQKQALGLVAVPPKNLPHCELLYLKDFSIEQLLASLRNIDLSVRKNIIQLLEDNIAKKQENFYSIIAKPSTFALLTIIWEKAHFNKRRKQLNSALVIQEYINYVYIRQQDKQMLLPLTSTEREYFMLGIAVGMAQQNDYNNQLGYPQLQYLVNQLIEYFPPALSKGQTHEELSRADFKERFPEDGKLSPKHKESILTDIRTCGILVRDPSKADHFKFAHQSFLEYLVALFYVTSMLKEETPLKKMTYGIQRAIEGTQQLHPSSEVIQFIGELLYQQPLPETSYSVAQYLYRLLQINQVSLYFAFMRKKLYLKPVPFITILLCSLVLSTFLVILITVFLWALQFPISTNLILLTFYPSLIYCFLLMNKKTAHYNEEILLRAQIWYKSCQIFKLNRGVMRSVMSNFTLKYLERYLRKIGALPKFPH